MGSRMDKYKDDNLVPTRSKKNKELYRQVYNAYDEFENLIVPSNAREIDLNDLKYVQEITSRQDYKKQRDYNDIMHDSDEKVIIPKREKCVQESKEEEVYDINELLNKAVDQNKKIELIDSDNISNDNYLKKLKLDNRKTNIEQVKELYDDISEDDSMEDESLMKTANLSLEILSDLKGDSDKTVVSAPIKNEEIPESMDDDFYSTSYKFSKKDFEKRKIEQEEEEEMDDEIEKDENGKFFFKILLLIFFIILIVLVLLYFINYFNRV